MIRKTYTLDLTEFDLESPRGQAVCTATETDGEWTCDIELDTDDLSKREAKALKLEVRPHFEADLRKEYGAKRFYWKGDRRSVLLQFQKGDRVKFKGGTGEVVYVVPDSSLGVKTLDGRVLNFTMRSLDHFLFKKV